MNPAGIRTFKCLQCGECLDVEVVAEHLCVARPEGPWESRVQNLSVTVRSWLFAAMTWAAVLWVAGVLLLLAFDVLCAWVGWAFMNMAWPVFAWWRLRELARDFLGPPPEPGPWAQAARAATQATETAAGVVTESWVFPALAMVAAVAGLGWLMLLAAGKSVRKVVYKMRGYVCESTIEGSEFTPAEIPKFQVAMESVGLLSTTHLGYGIRVSSWLVTPAHVRNGRKTLALVGPSGKMVLSVNTVVASRFSSDLEYIYLDEATWSKLGVTKAIRAQTSGSVALCVGFKGASSGVVKKTSRLGTLKYLGSTVPGMSGAAYLFGGRVHGMHVGAVPGEHNIGLIADVFFEEIRAIIAPESANVHARVQDGSAGQAEQAARVAIPEEHKMWDSRRIKQTLKAKYAEEPEVGDDTDWAAHVEDAFEDWTYESATGCRRRVLGGSTLQIPVEVKVKPHSDGAEEYLLEYGPSMKALLARVVASEQRVDELIEQSQKRFLAVEDEAKTLRQQLAKVREDQQNFNDELKAIREEKKQREEKVRFGCEKCDRQCGSEEKLAKHQLEHQKTTVPCEFPGCAVVCRSEVALKRHTETSHECVRQRFKCEICGVGCRSQERLARHEEFTCPGPKQESAQAGDFKKTVKQGGFLGQRRSSPKRKSRDFSKSSTTSVETPPWQSLAESQSRMSESLESLVSALKNLVPDMAGPSSAKRQN